MTLNQVLESKIKSNLTLCGTESETYKCWRTANTGVLRQQKALQKRVWSVTKYISSGLLLSIQVWDFTYCLN